MYVCVFVYISTDQFELILHHSIGFNSIRFVIKRNSTRWHLVPPPCSESIERYAKPKCLPRIDIECGCAYKLDNTTAISRLKTFKFGWLSWNLDGFYLLSTTGNLKCVRLVIWHYTRCTYSRSRSRPRPRSLPHTHTHTHTHTQYNTTHILSLFILSSTM